MQPFPQQLDIARQLDSSTATRQLDRPRQLLDAQAGIGVSLDKPRQARQELDRNSTGSTGKASTAPRRSLDSLTAPPQPGLIQVRNRLRRLVPAPRGRCVACTPSASRRPASRGPDPQWNSAESHSTGGRVLPPGSALGSSDTVTKLQHTITET